jgi:hypothetical protein
MKLIVFSLFVTCAFAFECSNYSSDGCKECVLHANSFNDGCVWCGTVDQNIISGNCYLYDDINLACQNVKNNYIRDDTQIYKDIKQYDCCNQPFRIGSKSEVTCSADIANIVSSETKNLILTFFIYTWVIGFITILWILISWKRNIIFSLINAILCPLALVFIFFMDLTPNPNEFYPLPH